MLKLLRPHVAVADGAPARFFSMRNREALDVSQIMTRLRSGGSAAHPVRWCVRGIEHQLATSVLVELTESKAECISYVYRLHAMDIVSGHSSRSGKEET